MIKNIITFLFVGLLVYASPIHAQNQSRMIEIFNIETGKVSKELPLNTNIQLEAKKLLSGITGIYKKVNPLPQKGLIVRIPLDPPFQVKNQWIHTFADEITIIFPIGEEPYLMIYDDENNFYFLIIDQKLSSKRLSKYLGVNKLLHSMKKG